MCKCVCVNNSVSEYSHLLKYKLSMHWEVIKTSMNEQKHPENKGKIMGTMEGGYLINGKK